MEALIALLIGMLTAGGIYLMLRGRTFTVVLGLTFMSYAVNLFLFAMGRLAIGRPPVIGAGLPGYADPVPQALVLTAIVIGFATSALFLVVLMAARGLADNDHVDGEAIDDHTALPLERGDPGAHRP